MLVVLINIILGYFAATGLYGYFIAYSPERKKKWLLATMVWVVVLVIIDSIYYCLNYFSGEKAEPSKSILYNIRSFLNVKASMGFLDNFVMRRK